ncbi:MAG: hypothetical protein ACR2PR_11965 [Pseudohongiellaceae bacterium]
MTTPDPRLMPFLEMLTEQGLGWLVSELLEGVQRGKEPEETEESLKNVRAIVENGGHIENERDAEVYKYNAEYGMSKPLLGDAQIKWAAEYVYERFSATTEEMLASFEQIDIIVANGNEGEISSSETPTALVLLDGDERIETYKTQISDVQGRLEKLEQILDNWVKSTKEDNQ